MGYRNLTNEQFNVIKDAAAKVCLRNNLETIGDFKRVGNGLIDEIENDRMDFADLLMPVIDYNPITKIKDARQDNIVEKQASV